MSISYEQLTFHVEDHVCTLTLNRPRRRNALTRRLIGELIAALGQADADPDVRVVVLTGAGGVFCSGADLSMMSEDPPEGLPGGFVELNLALARIRTPVIARIERYALAGALALVCGATFALAEEGAKFGAPEVKRGLFPMMVMASLFRTVSRRDGLELILIGESISAARAAEIGLISRAVPRDELDAATAGLARTLAARSPSAIRLGMEAANAQAKMDMATALPYLEEMLGRCLMTEDAAEGVAAFFEKREPVWTGR